MLSVVNAVFLGAAGDDAEEQEQEQHTAADDADDIEWLRHWLSVSVSEAGADEQPEGEGAGYDAEEEDGEFGPGARITYRRLKGKLNEPLFAGAEMTLLQVWFGQA